MYRFVVSMALCLLMSIPAFASQRRPYALAYFGQYSPRKYHEVPFSTEWDLKSQYLVALGLGRELTRVSEWMGLSLDLGVEAEGVVAHNWGRYGSNYQEIAGALVFRWHRFPWNHLVATTFGHGFGVSYATTVPQHEVRYRRGKSSRLLGFLAWDITLGPPRRPEWSAFFRIHHRSGAGGTFNGVHGASNYPTVGIRYTFR